MNVNMLSFVLEFCGRENNVVNVFLCSSWKLDFSSGADTWRLRSQHFANNNNGVPRKITAYMIYEMIN